jgi:ribosomal protein S18 acetylase RimI-like enzyme
MIRPTRPTDIDPLVSLAETTGVFKPHEIEALREVLDDYFAGEREFGHICETYESDKVVLGFAYYAPIPMTDRSWQLWWIAVTKQTQAKGIGGKLLKHVEETIRQKNGRLLLLETSALPYYELTRKFYLKHGYDQEATVRDYYSDGDSMVMFWKRLI